MLKRYIGDGVYADWDGWRLTLTTEDGISVTNRIVLDDATLPALIKFVDQLMDTENTALNDCANVTVYEEGLGPLF